VAEALDLLEDLDLDRYHLFHATRAELLGRIGRFEEADRAYEQALALTTNQAERLLLEEKRASQRQP
jgi:RNA polymerase sigma-70 factor (ECF subfamily)